MGRLLGATETAMSLCRTLAPLLGGVALDMGVWAVALLCFGQLALGALPLLWRMPHRALLGKKLE
jgi:hypothetical protein